MPDQPIFVHHKTFGKVKLLRKHSNGFIWEFELEDGRRLKQPERNFEQAEQPAPKPAPVAPSRRQPRPFPPDKTQFTARQTIETLRYGIVPVEDIKDLTIGLETSRIALERSLERAKQGGDVMAIAGDYGYGKTHFIELAAAEAKEKNFIVMTASLDLTETPPNKPSEIYKALVSNVRYPGVEGKDALPLWHLFKQAADDEALVDQFAALAPQPNCPITAALKALQQAPNKTVTEGVVRWISGLPATSGSVYKLPKLYAAGETARQYTYILSGLSVLAKMCGYEGLAVLIDESELYSQVRKAQRARADQFFMAMIYAAVGANGVLLNPNMILQNTRLDYPPSFSPNAHLCFMFALTIAEDQMPISNWLRPTQNTRLDERLITRDLGEFIVMLLRFHERAYGYQTTEDRYKGFLVELAKLLTDALNQQKLNIRATIKIAVEACDLLYLHPDYTAEALLAEIGKSLA
jgi:hypothetical protein